MGPVHTTLDETSRIRPRSRSELSARGEAPSGAVGKVDPLPDPSRPVPTGEFGVPARTHHSVVHVTAVHPTHDVRIFGKECRSLAANGFDVTLMGPGDGEVIVDRVRIIGVRRQDKGVGSAA